MSFPYVPRSRIVPASIFPFFKSPAWEGDGISAKCRNNDRKAPFSETLTGYLRPRMIFIISALPNRIWSSNGRCAGHV